jgi:hypothetical protein
MTQIALLPEIDAKPPHERPKKNYKLYRQLIRIYGSGPEGEVCAHCKHFYRKRYANTYFKCALAGDTNGPGTYWRARWRACGHFEPREEPWTAA